jgi:hypothetical protein
MGRVPFPRQLLVDSDCWSFARRLFGRRGVPVSGSALSARASESSERRKQMSALSRRAFLTTAAMASAGWAQPKQTSVVLLLTCVITDGGRSQLAFNGLKSLGPGFRTANAENIGLAQMQEVARGYSDDGFDLII